MNLIQKFGTTERHLMHLDDVCFHSNKFLLFLRHLLKIFKQLLRAATIYGESFKLSRENIGTFSLLILLDKIVAINCYYLGILNIEKGGGWKQEYVEKK